MNLFDRYSKLRKALTSGRVVSEQKEILKLLRGRLTEEDVPAVVVEPGSEEELRTTLRFAAEKHLKAALCAQLVPVSVRQLSGQMLVLTTRLAGAVEFRPSQGTVRTQGGVPVQSLAIDLARSGRRWLPLFPEPPGVTVGQLILEGWEGLRNWSQGGTLAHIRQLVWMGYDGTLFSTAGGGSPSAAPNISGFIFGSQGECGLVTSVELVLEERPASRSLGLFELPDHQAALEVLAALRSTLPVPEAVVYWNETATALLRDGNDGTVSPEAGVLIAAEWSGAAGWRKEWNRYGRVTQDDHRVNALWQDLLRFERIAARLYPETCEMRLRVPATALPLIAEVASRLEKDSSLPVTMWGTVEGGAMRISVLRPDHEARTQREAMEVLEEVFGAASAAGAAPVRGERMRFKHAGRRSDGDLLAERLHGILLERCNPEGIRGAVGG